MKAFEILVEDKRVLEKRDEYGPTFFAHMHRTKPYAKKKFKKSPNVQFRHKSVRSFRTTRTQESGEESWKVLEVKYHQELIRELHKKNIVEVHLYKNIIVQRQKAKAELVEDSPINPLVKIQAEK